MSGQHDRPNALIAVYLATAIQECMGCVDIDCVVAARTLNLDIRDPARHHRGDIPGAWVSAHEEMVSQSGGS